MSLIKEWVKSLLRRGKSLRANTCLGISFSFSYVYTCYFLNDIFFNCSRRVNTTIYFSEEFAVVASISSFKYLSLFYQYSQILYIQSKVNINSAALPCFRYLQVLHTIILYVLELVNEQWCLRAQTK